MLPLNRTQTLWLFAFLAAWAFFGLTGRDAWKPEEATALAPLLDWWQTGVFPAATQAPFHSLIAGLTAWLSAPWLDLQDGARLASGVLTLGALGATFLAARRLLGPGYDGAAALALLGCFGLMLRAHALLPEIALPLGYALLLYGLGLARTAPVAGAAAVTAAGVILMLSRGLPDLLALLLIAALPLVFRDWRTPTYRRALALSAAGLLLVGLVWQAILLLQGMATWQGWWSQAVALLVPGRSPGTILRLLSWFAWPVWPLAVWLLWHERRKLARASARASVPAPVLAALPVTLILAHWPSHSSGGSALPVLVPLALLAAQGLAELRRGAAQAFYWFGVLCFLFFATAFWVYFAAMELGWPARLGAHVAKLSLGYQRGAFPTSMLLIAVGATLLWLIAIPLFPRAKVRPLMVWATGMALAWVLFIGLFGAWGEAGWAYRPMLREMARQLPAGACLNADVDPAARAMLRLRLADRYRDGGGCAYRLVQSERDAPVATPEALVWQGFRPRRNEQLFLLYRLGR